MPPGTEIDRKSTRLNSSHLVISYAVFCLKKKKKNNTRASSNSAEIETIAVSSARTPHINTSVDPRSGPPGPSVDFLSCFFFCFFFNDTATTEIYTLSLHDALPIYGIHLRTISCCGHGCGRAIQHRPHLRTRPTDRGSTRLRASKWRGAPGREAR